MAKGKIDLFPDNIQKKVKELEVAYKEGNLQNL